MELAALVILLLEEADIEAVMHVDDDAGFCVECDELWPCSTRALMDRLNHHHPKELHR